MTEVVAEMSASAERLAKALPGLLEFRGATVVVKYGGNAMVDDELQRAFAEDVVVLLRMGLHPVVVHGGGPQITSMLDRLGIESTFSGGLRVTSPEAMDVVRMVLTGQVQREVVGLINQHGPLAAGMSGEDAHLFSAVQRNMSVDGQPVDVGQVGEIQRVDGAFVQTVIDHGLIPVVSSIARGEGGEVYNVNADTAAAALAVELGARKLVVLTDVAGVYANWPSRDGLMSEVSASELRDLLPSLNTGMAPKMEACLRAVDGGVQQAHVLDGRVSHALLREAFAERGAGTVVVP